MISRNAERVLTARLRDARFFWDADRKVPLESRIPRLDTILFHKKLGSYRLKAERVERLARWMAEHALGAAADARRRVGPGGAARQGGSRHRHGAGVHGAAGYDGRHLRARGGAARTGVEGDLLPLPAGRRWKPTRRRRASSSARRATTWAAVSLADKLDTLVGLVCGRRAADRLPRPVRSAAAGARRVPHPGGPARADGPWRAADDWPAARCGGGRIRRRDAGRRRARGAAGVPRRTPRLRARAARLRSRATCAR